MRTECVAATLRSYIHKKDIARHLLSNRKGHLYRMTTNCFKHEDNLTLLANCQNPNIEMFSDIVEIVPVTSRRTGHTYWNRACAACNNDADDVMEWLSTLIIKRMIPYFTNSPFAAKYPDTLEEMFDLMTSPRLADIIYTPPVSMADNLCMRRENVPTFYCENSSDEIEWDTTNWIFKSCRQLFSPVYRSSRVYYYMNVFCYLCGTRIELNDKKQTCSRENADKASHGSLSALLDYKPGTETSRPHDIVPRFLQGRCGCSEIYDPYQVIHSDLLCHFC